MAEGFFKEDILPLPKSQMYFALAEAFERQVKLIVTGEHPPVLSIEKSANNCACKKLQNSIAQKKVTNRETLITVTSKQKQLSLL
jgi:hypothetical protein